MRVHCLHEQQLLQSAEQLGVAEYERGDSKPCIQAPWVSQQDLSPNAMLAKMRGGVAAADGKEGTSPVSDGFQEFSSFVSKEGDNKPRAAVQQ